ncbi:Tim44 domain-containing protein [Alkalimarinus sediminis]|uniref:Tim44-like domain-containing protein n=1 Tax=Alkalimarinus sediminis TaxID=1632866 RepID=A0A9E8KQ58_9ALTE|nr:Tim44-like domain-containing protein [Alkalimarinus sediminis]UZW74855.1 Tim44-like domain-containing protein [Alkalimarinus sediminis]
MKKFWVIMTILFAFTLTTSHVEAKKFGGGKSFGKSFLTSPSKSKTAPSSNNSKQQAAPNTPAKGGMMKGMLGGLLAGGLIAALIGGGAFEGIQIMDIILIALVAFIAIRLFKGMAQAKMAAAQPAYAGNQTRQNAGSDMFGSSTSNNQHGDATFSEEKPAGFTNEESVPFNLPADFDINNFLSGARDHYRTIQKAWNENNIEMIKEYVNEELFAHLKQERASLSGEQHTEVMFVDAELVRADQQFGIAELSIKFSGRYRDTVENVEEDITDVWHLERDTTQDNAPWLIVGIEA